MKVILDRVFTLTDKNGNACGFGPGEADVPAELMPQLEEAATRRNARIEIAPTELLQAAPVSSAPKTEVK